MRLIGCLGRSEGVGGFLAGIGGVPIARIPITQPDFRDRNQPRPRRQIKAGIGQQHTSRQIDPAGDVKAVHPGHIGAVEGRIGRGMDGDAVITSVRESVRSDPVEVGQ